VGIKVQGFKDRVQLSEEQLDPSEAKPSLRVAPVLAAVVWVGSMLVATAIYMEWLPFFSRGTSQPQTAVAPLDTKRAARTLEPEAAAQTADASLPPVATENSTAMVDDQTQTPASQSAPGQPDPGKQDRKIRGSYAGARENWLAGW
jgi:hypothetical protein